MELKKKLILRTQDEVTEVVNKIDGKEYLVTDVKKVRERKAHHLRLQHLHYNKMLLESLILVLKKL